MSDDTRRKDDGPVKADRAIRPTLGTLLRQAREDAGIARRRLADMSGVGRMTILRLETDDLRTKPTAGDLMGLARALELNETDLFLLAGLPVPQQAASLDVMLRTGYGVSVADVPALKRQIEALIAGHAPATDATHSAGKAFDTEQATIEPMDTESSINIERRII